MTYLINNPIKGTAQNELVANNLSSRKLWSLLTEASLNPQDAKQVKEELAKRKHLSLFERRSAPH